MATSTFVKEGSPSQSVETITSSLAGIDLDGLTNSGLVDTPEAVSALVDVLHGLPVRPPSLYIDIEGVNLSRQGTISILQVFVRPKSRTYLVDIHILGNKAFATPGANGGTLKQILESETIPKVFFDVRNDSDALYSHFHIRLSGIQDLQLMELATRTFRRSHVNGLAKCIARDAPMGDKELVDWEATKENGIKLFQPNLGGSYEVFNERPLSEEIRTYCVQDVQFLPRLWTYYDAKITPRWRQRVLEASKERVTLSQAPEYNGQGIHMALAPQGWANLR
ncbi:uncharacterized protein DNG_06849 [Cephalotrichum gorgonifer]|uniref:3'-5' exonuclease domain-containing protein n=1 Tax=Cephalotrichum gorgonifer TaxID=2041049 RepID=A0AAE8N0K5_9PEZI|nr:uncharacterized protein DNG_06849 [Cephalotrichum gorgonifer]